MNPAKKRLFKLSVLLFLVILILFLRFTEEIGFDKHPEDRFTIIRVIDGDTVELNGGDRLRLISVDTPEKDDPYYNEAKDMVKRAVLNKRGNIDFAGYRRDKYGRLLGYLYIDTLFINKMILDSGLGYLYLFKDTELKSKQTGILLDAQRQAISNGIGIWSVKSSGEEYYLNSPGSFRLHRPGCRMLRGRDDRNYRKIKSRLEGFTEGLSPCRVCKP